MKHSEYEAYDGLGLAELVKNRQVTPSELLTCAIEQVERLNPRLNAVVTKLYDYAARAIGHGLPEGPFRGVPYLLKDLNGPLGGIPTTRGSRFFAAVAPPHDGELVARLKRAGLVIFGKTNTCELGLSVTCEPQLHGPTRNPWCMDRTSGGSSGGAAAAVAARMLPMAHATDGFGSIRVPAACCGLVGLKPSRGRVSLGPYLGEALAGLAIEHAVTRSVRDSAVLLDVTAGMADGDPYTAPHWSGSFLGETELDPNGLRIAFSACTGTDRQVAPEYAQALLDTAKLCAEFGHHVEEAHPEIDGRLAWTTFGKIVAANLVVTLSSHPEQRPPRSGELERVTIATAKLGETITADAYIKATQTAHRLGRAMAHFHRSYDVLLTPALAAPPVPLGWLDMMMEDVDEYWKRIANFTPFTVWFNLTGQPAMCIPSGRSSMGLPLSVQMSARYGDEATLFRLAAQIERARPWSSARPPLLSDVD